jgi:transposase-like protein
MRAAPTSSPAGGAEKPPPCPFCRSQNVGTTSKVISVATYWRCGSCGQIWNQSRLVGWKYR